MYPEKHPRDPATMRVSRTENILPIHTIRHKERSWSTTQLHKGGVAHKDNTEQTFPASTSLILYKTQNGRHHYQPVIQQCRNKESEWLSTKLVCWEKDRKQLSYNPCAEKLTWYLQRCATNKWLHNSGSLRAMGTMAEIEMTNCIVELPSSVSMVSMTWYTCWSFSLLATYKYSTVLHEHSKSLLSDSYLPTWRQLNLL